MYSFGRTIGLLASFSLLACAPGIAVPALPVSPSAPAIVDLAESAPVMDMSAGVCSKPLLLCGKVCVDPDSDPANCGNCGETCPTEAVNGIVSCRQGTCVVDCTAPYLSCGPGPVTHCDTNGLSDPRNCGKCGVVCGSGLGSGCYQGRCVLPVGRNEL